MDIAVQATGRGRRGRAGGAAASLLGLGLVGGLLLLAGGRQALAAAGTPVAAAADTVLVLPLRLDPGLGLDAGALRARLEQALSSQGRLQARPRPPESAVGTACVAPGPAAASDECGRAWGKAAGVRWLAQTEIAGSAARCNVALRLLGVAAEQPARQLRLSEVQPCTAERVGAELDRAGRELAAGDEPLRDRGRSQPGQPLSGPGILIEAVEPDPAAGDVPLLARPPLPEAPPPPELPAAEPQLSGGEVVPALGGLAVSARAGGGPVRLDLKDPAGRTISTAAPYRNDQAAAGIWRVEARAANHEPLRRTFLVGPAATARIELDLQPLGALEVVGEPAGAVVVVSGPRLDDRRGLPWTGRGLVSGHYRVLVGQAGYRPWTTMAEVRAGRTTRLRVALTRLGDPTAERLVEWVSLPGGPELSPLEMMRSEVTVAMYRACVQAGACAAGELDRPGVSAPLSAAEAAAVCTWGLPGGESHPLNCVAAAQAETFCAWAGGRLPDAAEWQRGASGPAPDRRYPWGDADWQELLLPAGNFADAALVRRWPALAARRSAGGYDDGYPATSPAGELLGDSSPEGLVDLGGNVREWVRGGPSPASPPAARGGSWADPLTPEQVRATSAMASGERSAQVGFRCVR